MTTVPAKIVSVDTSVSAAWSPSELVQDFCVETSLPQETPAQRGEILAIIEGDCLSGESLIGSEFWLSHHIMHPVELTDADTGEIVRAVRTLLPQPDGECVSFVSLGIIKSLGRIAWATGRTPPYIPPIRVKLVQRSTGNGRRTYKLVPLEA